MKGMLLLCHAERGFSQQRNQRLQATNSVFRRGHGPGAGGQREHPLRLPGGEQPFLQGEVCFPQTPRTRSRKEIPVRPSESRGWSRGLLHAGAWEGLWGREPALSSPARFT